jgi:hypothetical protein
MPFLIIRPGVGGEPQAFPIGKKWSSEPRSQAGVPWMRSPPLDRPAHELTKSDFEIELDPAAGGAGFDPLLLPDIAPATSGASTPTSHIPATDAGAVFPPP